jgi:PAS domain S-box-containing protein
METGSKSQRVLEWASAMSTFLQAKSDRRALILVFLLFSLAMGAAGFYFYENQKTRIKQEMSEELRAITDLKVRLISNWRKDRLADAEVILETPFIAEHVQQLLAGQKPQEAKKEILEWMQAFQEHYQYDSILLLDPEQEIRLSVPRGQEPPPSYERDVILESIQKRKAILSDLYQNEVSGAIRLCLVVPILIARRYDIFPVGTLLLRIDPDEFLYPIIESWPTPSPSSESILVRREGEEVIYLNHLRHQQTTPLVFRVRINPKDIAKAAYGKEGVVETLDYRLVPVLSAVRRIPDSPWVLVAKVDQREIYGSIREAGFWTAVVVGLLIAGLGLTGGLFWYKQDVYFQRSMASQAEKQAKMLDEILAASPDLTYMCDREGRYVYANPAFLQALRLSRSDVIGKTYQEVGFSSEIAEQILTDRESVFASGRTVTGEARLPTTEGVRDYEYIKSPIHGSGGSIDYVVVSARDITRRKEGERALRESENRLRFLSGQLLVAQENERKRIAGELHDSIAADLSGFKFKIEESLSRIEKGTEAYESLSALVLRIQRTMEETRRIMADLRPAVLDLGIVPATQWLCREFEKTYSCICIERRIGIENNDVPDLLKTPIFRILQEALNNVAKHSKATLVKLSLHETEGEIGLMVQDNGQGFNTEGARSRVGTAPGLGLVSMRERVELSGGSFSIESAEGRGTTIRAWWPLNKRC